MKIKMNRGVNTNSVSMTHSFMQLLRNKLYKKTKHIINHKVTLAVVLISYVVSSQFSPLTWYIAELLSIAPMILIIIPWLIFQHLLLNRTGFKLCVKSFDYWIKVSYAAINGISLVFCYSSLPGEFRINDIRHLLTVSLQLLATSYISLFDASHGCKRTKLFYCGVAALYISFLAFFIQFVPQDPEMDYQIMLKYQNRVKKISFLSLMSSSYRIVAIFFANNCIKHG
eukprot:82665_1